MVIKNKVYNIHISKNLAGLICFSCDNIDWSILRSLHFFIRKSYWVFGKKESWYDGPIISYGLGPLFLYSRMG